MLMGWAYVKMIGTAQDAVLIFGVALIFVVAVFRMSLISPRGDWMYVCGTGLAAFEIARDLL